MQKHSCLALVLAFVCCAVQAQDGGPDFWRVKGLKAGDELNLRRGPAVAFTIVEKIPHDARRLLNLGCYPGFGVEEWQRLSKEEQQLATRMRWCRVMHGGTIGWAYARYLKED